ncbi:hypothetical protein AJ85_08500 [Alkalihalobacillus alcalophilus ATCC 27647 = CGMCC 1.3604]|uniref:RNA polymerase subunit sigma-70 n=1 Tax=Alkalihalobacillus alcalophilus ATCC 27647 = CGMCC 1.3604 TaxID=1218173 RepID=A0A4S4K454_ALKAL|nr:hypothetical protein [Alkalihalobacillus alcalophilus]MED1562419.1 hypothetical protein [Alkalihalobacillus alcalophilus]THG90849.1 hypothetical protein AJ85_08500 [Alkalihalobacillus alcalophilus ATCC 27647 = CGMCC 1.3604]
MRASHNHQMHLQQAQPIFHVDYHNFIEKEALQTNFELAHEFGVSLREIKILKQKLMRN